MPIYDVYCEKCGHEEIDVYMNVNDDNPICPLCRLEMVRAANTGHFKLLYDPKKDLVDWDGNRSRYYDEYKKQKAEGKDVRIAQLDGDG
jgi:putative FmdB family regulatory protein